MVLKSFIKSLSEHAHYIFGNNYHIDVEEFTIEDTLKKLSGRLIIAGFSIDKKSINKINNQILDYEKIGKIVLLISRANYNPDFLRALNAFAKDVSDFKIDLEIKVASSKIPFDIYFFNENSALFYLTRTSIDDPKLSIKKSINPKLRKEIINAIKTSEDITSIWGEAIYYPRYDKLFQIKERRFCPLLEEKIFNALFQWEKSDYHDIKSLIDVFEYSVRHFIVIRLKPLSRSSWFSQFVFPVLGQNAETQIKKRFKSNMFGFNQIDQHPFPVEYLVCENYIKILKITPNPNPFIDFQAQGIEFDIYREYFEDIVDARNPQFHTRHRSITTDFHSNTIVKILVILQWFNKIEPKLSTLNYEIGEYDPIVNLV